MHARTLFAALALATTTPASAQWQSLDYMAFANPGEPVVVGIAFNPGMGCHVADLFIIGNENILAAGVVVDSDIFPTVAARNPLDDLIMMTLSAPALSALKTGQNAAVVTDQGTIMLTLRGSTAAINSAYAGCMAQTNPTLRPLLPSNSRTVTF
jgi:hypothetical protein